MLKPDAEVMFTVYDYNVAALIIFCISIVGTGCNVIVAFYTRTLPSMNNSFGRLMASQATGEGILCAVFAFLVAPMIMFDISAFWKISAQFGWVNLICYDICCFSHLFIALNRMAAICTPLQYDRYFSLKNTRYLITISWVVPILTAVVLYKLFTCDFYISEKFWAFVFTQNEACNFISWNIDFYKDITVVSVIAVVDLITIYNVHATSADAMRVSTVQQARRRKNEINFLKQACLQGIVFVVELLTYFIFAWKFENKWIVFLLSSVAWNLVHCTDPIIIITFNKEFRALITRPFRNIHKVHSSTGHSETTRQIVNHTTETVNHI